MQLRERMPICWVYQAVAGSPAVRKPGRVAELAAGHVRIRIFDEELNAWAYRLVKPITLQNIDPAAAATLERLEGTVPIPEAERRLLVPSAPTASTQQRGPDSEPVRDEPLVRAELVASRKDIELVLCTLRALADPGRAEITRTLLMTHFGREGINPGPLALMRDPLDWRITPGRMRGPSPDLDVRFAYRILVMREKPRSVARQLHLDYSRVIQRVHAGVDIALNHAADPALEQYRFESIPMLRRRAAVLKPALEKAFLSILVEMAEENACEQKINEPRAPGYNDFPADFDVKLAYRVLIDEEQCAAVGRALGLTPEQALRRVRSGVQIALNHAEVPQPDWPRYVRLHHLQQAPSLKSALEMTLSMLQAGRRATVAKALSAQP